MSRIFIALVLLCTLLEATTSLPHEQKRSSENDQKKIMITRQETAEATGTSAQAPAEEPSTPEESESTNNEPTGAEMETSPNEPTGINPETQSNEPTEGETETPTEGASGNEPTEGGNAPTGDGEPTPPEPSGGEPETPEAEPSVVEKEYNANEATDWIITLTINHPPADTSSIRFQEGDGPKVGIGESTESFEFREGKEQEDGMLEIPVFVKDQTETKQITFTVELNEKPTLIKVNVEMAGPAFKVLENPIKATEETQYKFTLKIEAMEPLEYTLTEKDEETVPGGETHSLKFGDLVRETGENTDNIEVTVTDISKNNLTFDVSAKNQTETVTVEIEPPTKPLLLKKDFTVGKSNDLTLTLEIKAKSAPDVSFKDDGKEYSAGDTSPNFIFGTMTNDEENLYKITVKLPEAIKESKKFTITLDEEVNEVTVKPEDDSSALKSTSATLACIFVPLMVMFLL